MPKVEVRFRPIEVEVPDNIYKALDVKRMRQLAVDVVANIAVVRLSAGEVVDPGLIESVEKI